LIKSLPLTVDRPVIAAYLAPMTALPSNVSGGGPSLILNTDERQSWRIRHLQRKCPLRCERKTAVNQGSSLTRSDLPAPAVEDAPHELLQSGGNAAS